MATSVTATERETGLFNSVKAKGTGYHPGVQLTTVVPKSETVPLNPELCKQQTLRDKQHEMHLPKLESDDKRYSYG